MLTPAEQQSMTFDSAGGRPFLSDFTNYGSFGDWWNSLSSAQQIQAGMLGASTGAKRHFGYGRNEDTGYRPSGYTPVNQPAPTPAPQMPTGGSGVIQQPTNPPPMQPTPSPGPTGGGIVQQPGQQTGGALPANQFNPQPTSPYPTTIPDMGGVRNTFNDYFEGDAYGVYGPPPSASTGGQQGGNFGTMGGLGYGPNPLGTGGPGGSVWQTWQPQTGMFGTPSAQINQTMYQDFNSYPWLTGNHPVFGNGQDRLLGDWLGQGQTLSMPGNLMGNVPQFGQVAQQGQWGGYWPSSLTGFAGPHGIAPGYSFANSNSPVNYTGLFAQSDPHWGNPLLGPTFPYQDAAVNGYNHLINQVPYMNPEYFWPAQQAQGQINILTYPAYANSDDNATHERPGYQQNLNELRQRFGLAPRDFPRDSWINRDA